MLAHIDRFRASCGAGFRRAERKLDRSASDSLASKLRWGHNDEHLMGVVNGRREAFHGALGLFYNVALIVSQDEFVTQS